MAARNRGRGGRHTGATETGRNRSWGDRWRSKSLMGHARTHPFATAMAATAAAAGAGALFWARRDTADTAGRPADMGAMVI